MRHEVETAFGPIWLWGEITGQPILLLITGAFAEPDVLDMLPRHLPRMDVLRAHLPGNHCPETTVHSIGVYSEALAKLAPDAPLTVLGLSTGALVALALRAPNLRQLLLVEPPLRTGELWPLAERFAAPQPGYPATFVWEIFGMGRAEPEPRDYTPLLDRLTTPAIVLLGDLPLLPRRELAQLPSLVGEPERARLRAHPWIRTAIAPGCGHNIPAQNSPALFVALRRALPPELQPLSAADLAAGGMGA